MRFGWERKGEKENNTNFDATLNVRALILPMMRNCDKF